MTSSGKSRSAGDRSAGDRSAGDRSADPLSPDNAVFLRGRLAAEPVLRQLPSGDELCVFRLTVPRPAGERGRVDSIDCATTGARVRRSVQAAEPGELIEVSGCLRRRFWRSAAGLGSRYEVEVRAVTRLRRRRSDA